MEFCISGRFLKYYHCGESGDLRDTFVPGMHMFVIKFYMSLQKSLRYCYYLIKLSHRKSNEFFLSNSHAAPNPLILSGTARIETVSTGISSNKFCECRTFDVHVSITLFVWLCPFGVVAAILRIRRRALYGHISGCGEKEEQ